MRLFRIVAALPGVVCVATYYPCFPQNSAVSILMTANSCNKSAAWELPSVTGTRLGVNVDPNVCFRPKADIGALGLLSTQIRHSFVRGKLLSDAIVGRLVSSDPVANRRSRALLAARRLIFVSAGLDKMFQW